MKLHTLPFVLIPPHLARCGVCDQLAACQMGDTELERYLCRDCVECVYLADVALNAARLSRPPKGLAFTEENR